MNGRKAYTEMPGDYPPLKAYSWMESARSGFNVGTLGLGVAQQITPRSSLLTVVTLEAFSAALGLVVLGHEIGRICANRDLYTSGRSTYLFFRLGVLLTSIIGLAFVSTDLSDGKTDGNKTTIGTVLIALSLFGSRALTASLHKITPTVKNKDEVDEEKQGIGEEKKDADEQSHLSNNLLAKN